MANVGNVVRLIAIKGTHEGVEEATAAVKDLTGAFQGVAVETEKVSRGSISVAAAWKRQTMQMDEVARASMKLAQEYSIANKALAQGDATVAQYNVRLQQLAKTFDTTAIQAKRFADQQAAMVNSAQNINQRLRVTNVFESAPEHAQAIVQQMDAMRAKWDPLFAAGLKYRATLREINEDAAAGALTEKQRLAAITQTKTAFVEQVNSLRGVGSAANNTSKEMAALTKQSSRNAAEMLNLGRQAADVAVSLQAGQSILVVGLQQGAQIIDVIASSQRSMGQIASSALGWAKNFVTSTAGIVTGIGAIAAGALFMGSSWQEGQREIDKALIGVGKRAGTTREDINKLAEASASSSRLSVSESRTAALEFVKTGNIYSENLKGLVGLVKGHSVMIGESAEEAAKQLAKIFGDENIGAVADNLSKMYTGISGATRQFAVDLDVAGKRQQALAVLVNAITPSIKEAADATGFWAKRWDELSKVVAKFGEGVGKIGTAIAPAAAPQEQLEKKRGQLSVAEPALAQMREDAAAMGRDLVPGLEQAEEQVRSLREAIVMLENQIISLKNAPEKARLELLGKQADAVVKSFVPFIEQLEVAEKALNKLKEARDAMAAGKNIDMGQAKFLQQGIDAGEVRVANTKSEKEMAERRNAYMAQLLRTEQESVQLGGVREGQQASTNLSVLMQLDSLQRQLPIAQAVGQMAQIEAQHKARVAELSISLKESEATRIADAERLVSLAQIETQHRQTMLQLQGQLSIARAVTGAEKINAEYANTVSLLTDQIGLAKAIEQAEMGRAIAIADANTQAEQMLNTLRQEGELIRASSDAERDRIAARQTYDNLIAKQVDSTKAAAIASQQLSNANERRWREEAKAAEDAVKSIKSATDAWAAYEKGTISWSVANDEAGKATRRAEAAQQALGGSVFDTTAELNAQRAAWEANAEAMVKFTGLFATVDPNSIMLGTMGKNIWQAGPNQLSQFNPAGYTSTSGVSSPQTSNLEAFIMRGFEAQLNTAMSSAGGNLAAAVGSMISQGNLFTGGATDPQKLTQLNRMIELMPQEQQISSIQGLIGQLGTAPQTLQTAEMTKQLNDKLTQLTQATEANTSATSAQTDVLSPFYSSDPRRTHLGFRAFAGGGIMTQYGELPLRHYQGGGMATSPQVAVFGEGSTPEAYVPVPSGRIPVEVKAPANSNQKQRPVVVNINVMGNADAGTVAALKTTAFQQAQAMRRVMG